MLNKRSKQVRRDAIELSLANGGYHYGGSFSCAEILINLFDNILKEEDRFILSKGHGCWAYYVLLRERGFNPTLEGHPHFEPENGIFCTAGSMGHGLPVAIGQALARKLNKDTSIISDNSSIEMIAASAAKPDTGGNELVAELLIKKTIFT